MHVIYYGRQHGKTNILIEKALENPGSIILTATVVEANLINNKVGKPIAMAYYNFQKESRGRNISAVYIDNLEYIVSSMFGNVDTVTMSDDNVTIQQKDKLTEFQY